MAHAFARASSIKATTWPRIASLIACKGAILCFVEIDGVRLQCTTFNNHSAFSAKWEKQNVLALTIQFV